MSLYLVLLATMATMATTAPPNPTPAQPTSSAADYLLPRSTTPLNYSIIIETDIENEVFNGSVRIAFLVEEPTRTVVLHSRGLEIEANAEKIVVSGEEDQPQFVRASFSRDAKDYFSVVVDRELEAGKVYELFVGNFSGEIVVSGHGYYLARYDDEDGTTRKLATTQFESTFAREAFPCFDEPSLKANFTFTSIRPENYTTIFNTPLVETIFLGNGKYQDTFETTKPMSSYLLAWQVSDFEATEFEGYGQVYARREAIKKGWADWAKEIGTKAIDTMQEFVQFPFMLEKIDQVGIPSRYYSSGAMENWGLVTYMESYLLYIEENPSMSSSKMGIATVIVHEYAHQWFGDLVSPKWWNYLWLNEGFATYFENFATALIGPEWDLEYDFIVNTVRGALRADSTRYTHSMDADIGSPDDIENFFDNIAYSKAGSVIRMFETFLTLPVFKEGLTVYLNKMQYSAAVSEDLYSSWQQVIDEQGKDDLLPPGYTVSDVMSSWESATGYPVIFVSVNYDEEVIYFNQSRFFENGDTNTDQTWLVPLTFTLERDGDFDNLTTDFWLLSLEDSLPVQGISPDKWIIVNNQQRGFYRVNYNEANWLRIIESLRTNTSSIDRFNRAQLIDDSSNLASAGQLDYSIAFDISNAVNSDFSFLTLSALVDFIHSLDLRLSSTPIYGIFTEWAVDVLTPSAKALGLRAVQDERREKKMARGVLVKGLCGLGERRCVEEAINRVEKWMKGEDSVEEQLQEGFLCGSVKGGEGLEFVFQLVKEANGELRKKAVKGLGCSEDAAVLNRFLQMILDEDNGFGKELQRVAIEGIINGGETGRELLRTQLEISNKLRHFEISSQLQEQLDVSSWRQLHYSSVEDWLAKKYF